MSTWDAVALLLLIMCIGSPLSFLVQIFRGRMTLKKAVLSILFWIVGTGAAFMCWIAALACHSSCNTSDFPLLATLSGLVGLFLYAFCFMALFENQESNAFNSVEKN